MDKDFWSRICNGASLFFAAGAVVVWAARMEYDRFYLATANRMADFATGEINPVTIKGISAFLDDRSYALYSSILPGSLCLGGLSVVSWLMHKKLAKNIYPINSGL
ncbi:hypothetical protein [Luteimonas sp. 9C]|uniref:hypothetical protein n=1 Tax=Luteimonas sp. 9C TaxID=2653148 RepID=UPI00135C3E93|nr:hypothetical protein [Luteimonas sp. 9C]